MAARKDPTTTPPPAEADAPALSGALALVRADAAQAGALAAQHDALVRAVAHQVGYLLPADATDPDLIQRDIAANMRRSVEACLEVGRGLAVLKAACGHGNFLGRLDALGIEPRVAQRFMATTAKFANAALKPHLLKAIGSQTKLFEMLVLDDEQVEELDLTGQTGELKLDDIATMSVKELRAALRKERHEVEAKEALLEAKNKRMDRLQADLRLLKKLPADEVLAKMLAELQGIGHGAAGIVIAEMRPAFEQLQAHHAQHGGDSSVQMAAAVATVQCQLNALRTDFGLPDVSAARDKELMDEVAQWGGQS